MARIQITLKYRQQNSMKKENFFHFLLIFFFLGKKQKNGLNFLIVYNERELLKKYNYPSLFVQAFHRFKQA
jgi:hypothetical protein